MTFLAAILFIVLALFLQFASGAIFGIWVSFVLATLVVSAFFLNIWKFLSADLAAVYLLSWRPDFSWEIAAVFCLPLAAWQLRETLPYKQWLTAVVFISASFLLLYLFFGLEILMARQAIFAADLALGLLYGAFVFIVLRRIALRRNTLR